jgi:hypothetical protein
MSLVAAEPPVAVLQKLATDGVAFATCFKNDTAAALRYLTVCNYNNKGG